MTTNQSPEYLAGQKKFLAAKTDEERLVCMEEMLRFMPQHKCGEAMRANLRTRYKKLQEKIESKKKTSKGKGKPGIKKEGLQAVILGLTNSGKSSVLSSLTNAQPQISNYNFTTRFPIIGTLDYSGVKIQIIDLPAIESEYFDQGAANTADVLLMVIEKVEDIKEIESRLPKAFGTRIIVFNKIDILSSDELRKTEARLRSKKLNFVLFSAKTKSGREELEEKMFLGFRKIRVYTKQPKKPADKDPVVLEPRATVKELADKIFHGLSSIAKEARVTGPSSKFPNQKVGLDHQLKDKDIVEFKT